MSGAVGIIAGVALLWGAGRGLLRVLHVGGSSPVAGWSFLFGAGLIGTALQIPLAIDGRISSVSFAVAALGCVALTVVGWRRVRGDWPWSWNVLGWLASLSWPGRIVGVLAITSLMWVAIAYPGVGYDSRSIYRLKAKLLYDSGDSLSEDFQSLDRINFNASYPLLMPLLEAQLFWFAGGVTERGLQVLFAAFVLSAASILVDVIRRNDTSRWAATWGLLFLLTPMIAAPFEGGGLSGCADLPFACFVLGALTWRGQPESETWRDAVARGLLGAAAVVTKPEGMIWAGLAVVVFVVGRLRARSLPRVLVARVAAVAAVVVAAVLVKTAIQSRIPVNPYHRHYAAAISPDWLGRVVVRAPEIAAHTGRELLDGKWGGWWACAVGAVLLLRRRASTPPEIRFIRAMCLVSLTTYLAIFLITPLHLAWHLESALPRLLLHLFPLSVIVTAEQAAAAGWTTRVSDFFYGLTHGQHQPDARLRTRPTADNERLAA